MTTDLTISERVSEMHAVADAQPPDEVMHAFRPEQADLAATGLPAGIAPVGTVVADTDLLDPTGNATTLYDATADATPSWGSTAAPGARTATSPLPATRPSYCPGSPNAASASSPSVRRLRTVPRP